MANSSGTMNIFTIIFLSIIASCLIFSCYGYILSHRKYRKRDQTLFINQTYIPKIQEQIFTIKMPYTQSSSNEQSTPYLSDKCLPSYETVENSTASK